MIHVLDLALVDSERLLGLLHGLGELVVLLLVVGEDLLELLLLRLLDFGLLPVDERLLPDLLLLRRDLLGHLLLDGRLLSLLLRDLVLHQLAFLFDLLHKRLVLRPQLRVLRGHVPALLFREALRVLADLLPDLRQVRLEVRDDILSLDLLRHDNTLMVLLKSLVLVLVLSSQNLILV